MNPNSHNCWFLVWRERDPQGIRVEGWWERMSDGQSYREDPFDKTLCVSHWDTHISLPPSPCLPCNCGRWIAIRHLMDSSTIGNLESHYSRLGRIVSFVLHSPTKKDGCWLCFLWHGTVEPPKTLISYCPSEFSGRSRASEDWLQIQRCNLHDYLQIYVKLSKVLWQTMGV